MTDYEIISELATETARKFSRERIIEIMWMPLQLLYVEMAKRKEIPALMDLDKETKEKYWQEVNKLIPDRKQERKIWAAQAIYMLDLIQIDVKTIQ